MRSHKKAKGSEPVVAILDATMGEVLADGDVEMVIPPKLPMRSLVSYRDLVAGVKASVKNHRDDDDGWLEDELSDDEMEDGETDLKKKLGPGVDINKERRIELCKPWRRSLVINVLGKEVGYRLLLNRIQKLWNPKGTMDMIDMKNNHFLVMFSSDSDLSYALEEGPWMVAGHYLLCQRRRPEFNPYEDKTRRQAVWVRILGLPFEYYEKHVLWEIGNEIGKTLRVDGSTIDEVKLKMGSLSTERG